MTFITVNELIILTPTMAEPQWMDKASPASQGRGSLAKHVILKEGYLVKKVSHIFPKSEA